MTREEYQVKIKELKEQKNALNAQIEQVKKEFKDSLLMELEEQGITPGTKVSVKTKTRLLLALCMAMLHTFSTK